MCVVNPAVRPPCHWTKRGIQIAYTRNAAIWNKPNPIKQMKNGKGMRSVTANDRGQAQPPGTDGDDRKTVRRTPKPGNGNARRLLPAPICSALSFGDDEPHMRGCIGCSVALERIAPEVNVSLDMPGRSVSNCSGKSARVKVFVEPGRISSQSVSETGPGSEMVVGTSTALPSCRTTNS